MNAGVMCPCMEGKVNILDGKYNNTWGRISVVYIGKSGLYLIGGGKDSLGHWEV